MTAAEDFFNGVADVFNDLARSILDFLITPAHGNEIDPSVNQGFNAAFGWRQPRYDSLTLDLDGDGLETVGINTAAPSCSTTTATASRPAPAG